MDSILTDQRKWTRKDVAQLLISQTALTELDMVDALKIVALMEPRRFKAGIKLTQEGFTNTDYMLLILHGEAVVENEFSSANDSMVISVLGPGSLVGELGILDGEPRSATCTAVTDIDVAVLDRDHIAKLMKEEPLAACNLMGAILKRVSERLRATNKKLRTLTVINRSLLDELETLKTGLPPRPVSIPQKPTPLLPRVSGFGKLEDFGDSTHDELDPDDAPDGFHPTYPGGR